MVTKVQKWVNSLALRIPKAFALQAQLESDSFVELTMVEGQIIITPVVASSWTLDELLAGINKKNIHREVDTGSAVGNELSLDQEIDVEAEAAWNVELTRRITDIKNNKVMGIPAAQLYSELHDKIS